MISTVGLISLLLVSGSTAALSPWTLKTTDFLPTVWEAQPYVANGYISQRLPACGMGYYQIPPLNASADDGTSGWPLFDPRFTASMVAGFYDQQPSTPGTNFPQTGGEQPISTLPTWSPIYLTVNGSTYTVGTPSTEIREWEQSLSLQNGVVKTSMLWSPNADFNVSLKYTIFAHRSRPNLGVVRLDVRDIPLGTRVIVTDVLDDAGTWRTTPVSSGTLPTVSNTIYSAVRPNGIGNITAYVVSHLTFHDVSLSTEPLPSCFAGVKKNVSIASQCYFTEPSARGAITVIKYVGIASSDAFPGTELETAHAVVIRAAADGYPTVLTEHNAAWNAMWDSADIIIPGDTAVLEGLQLSARASLFHLLSNVRQGSEPHGLGDNSIAPAGLTSDSYAGQIFWDADTWMAPSLIALFPSYAESITNFRYRQLGAAKENSKQFNRTGALYPWTAARFGNCTGVGPCYNYEYHIENDISLSQYQYFAGTQNVTWLREKGWPVISSIADFWVSQVIYNTSTGTYSTFNETDPDEFANFRNNAAYTNAGISVILKNAVGLATLLGIDPPSSWTKISQNIVVLRDRDSGVTLEYDGFNGSTAVKQADVVLLTYPLEYNESVQEASLDLTFYGLATSPNGPGMTYSIFSVDESAISNVGCASYTYLLAASQPYLRAPFYQFSEQTTDTYATNGGTNPAYTFLTGHGGFLQSLTHGFTGYRSRLNAFYLDPTLPEQLPGYTVKGMKWRDSVLDVTITRSETTIVRRRGATTTVPVEIGPNNPQHGNYTLRVGQSLTIPTRRTNGTLIPGNMAQCKAVLSSDTTFIKPNKVVPGQFALAAVDGSNATAWQPLVNSSSSMTVDLGSTKAITGLHLNWGNNPARSYLVSAGEALDHTMVEIASGEVGISVPWDPATADQVSVKVGNVTNVQLKKAVRARYVNVTVAGSYAADGKGGTLAEIAVL